MVTIERTTELLKKRNLSDTEIEHIRDAFNNLAEIVFEKWILEKNNDDMEHGTQ